MFISQIVCGKLEIEYSTFQGCHRLKNIKIPDSVTIIRAASFRYCISLTNVNLPEAVFIEEGAFEGCENLKVIN